MENYVYGAIGALVLIYILYQLINGKRNRRLKLLSRVRSSYGAVPKREYTEEELKKIRTYSDMIRNDGDYYVDDITWNDLDLDAVYAAINHTHSSVGEEVLYDILRRPIFSEDELKERNRVIELFTHDSNLRESLSMDYASVGRTKKYSLIEYLSQFRQLKTLPDYIPYFHLLLIPACILIAFFLPTIGITALILSIIFNLIFYYRNKANIEPYFVSLQAMAYLTNAAQRISERQAPGIEAYLNQIKKELQPVKSLSKEIFWIGNGSVGSSMDLIQVALDYLRMITHIDFIVFNRMVKKVVNNENHMLALIRTMGFLEAMISVASYRQTIPFFTTGEFTSEGEGVVLKNGYHPLIKEPVANSVEEGSSLLITGSNASGKSTFLRMTALCALFSQTIATVHATEYRAPFFRIYSSMALRDDIQSSESYFIVEIRSMKRIMDAVEKEGPRVLCFVDEVLRGTNTVERIAASSQILKTLSDKGAFVFAATHDIELTQLLKGIYANYHFTEEVEEDRVTFSYKLLPGEATTRNAIRLLKIMGYDDKVVENATKEAEEFMKNGTWSLVK